MDMTSEAHHLLSEMADKFREILDRTAVEAVEQDGRDCVETRDVHEAWKIVVASAFE